MRDISRFSSQMVRLSKVYVKGEPCSKKRKLLRAGIRAKQRPEDNTGSHEDKDNEQQLPNGIRQQRAHLLTS
jgi:hypothetical protein